MSDPDETFEASRRDLLRNAGLLGIAFAIPSWVDNVCGAEPKTTVTSPLLARATISPIPVPQLSFKKNKTGDGIVGPHGEVRVAKGAGGYVPIVVSAAGGLALMDMTVRSPLVRFGAEADKSAIVLTAEGVKFGEQQAVAWNAEVVKRVMAELAKDEKKARGALLLRAALHTSFPVAVKELKGNPNEKVQRAVSKAKSGLGADSMNCTTTTVTETVEKAVTDSVAVVKTALEQWQDCYDKALQSDACKLAALAGSGAAAVCASLACVLDTFADIVTGWIQVVTTTTEEVTRRVITCASLAFKDKLPNPFDLFIPVSGKGGTPQLKLPFGQKEVDQAVKFVKGIGGFLGQYQCLLDGTWSLAQLDTKIDLGDGNLVFPYGVKLCISGACAELISPQGAASTLAGGWGAALGAIAALDHAAGVQLAAVGVTANAGVGTAVTALTAAVGATAAGVIVSLATIIICFLLVALLWATAIAAQMFFCSASQIADGICLEHPTLAVALIELLSLGILSVAQLTPPIVKC